MKLLRTWDNPEEKFTLVFLGYGPEESNTVLELTYNYGQEKYEHGGAYGHICIGVDDVDAEVAKMREAGVPIDYHSDDGFMAFVVDPDGYYIELLNEKRMIEKANADMKTQGTA